MSEIDIKRSMKCTILKEFEKHTHHVSSFGRDDTYHLFGGNVYVLFKDILVNAHREVQNNSEIVLGRR